jgi:DNA-binding phage protein
MAEKSPQSAAQAARAALDDVTDHGQKAVALALLAVCEQLREMAETARHVDARLEQINQYLGAIANKP